MIMGLSNRRPNTAGWICRDGDTEPFMISYSRLSPLACRRFCSLHMFSLGGMGGRNQEGGLAEVALYGFPFRVCICILHFLLRLTAQGIFHGRFGATRGGFSLGLVYREAEVLFGRGAGNIFVYPRKYLVLFGFSGVKLPLSLLERFFACGFPFRIHYLS